MASENRYDYSRIIPLTFQNTTMPKILPLLRGSTLACREEVVLNLLGNNRKMVANPDINLPLFFPFHFYFLNSFNNILGIFKYPPVFKM